MRLRSRLTTRVQDLVSESRATPWFWLYFASVGAASIAAFLGAPLAFRIAAFGMLVATIKVCVELVSTRTLRSAPTAMLPDDDLARPRLLLSSLQTSRR